MSALTCEVRGLLLLQDARLRDGMILEVKGQAVWRAPETGLHMAYHIRVIYRRAPNHE